MNFWLKSTIQAFGFYILTSTTSFAQDAAYVGSEACVGCHQEQSADWEGSHHAQAWTPATDRHVLGDFDNARYQHDGVSYVFTRRTDAYFVEVSEANGAVLTHQIHSVAGFTPLQQYLIETASGTVQSFDVVWDTLAERWYHLYPDQSLPLGDGLHWSGPYKNWNARCAECHATDYQRNFGANSNKYRSTYAETGVGCESCHGPGSAHLQQAEQGESWEADFGFSADTRNAQQAMEQCAGCHSRREPLTGGSPLPGTDFHDAYRLAWLSPGLYHPDGQIKDEVYVWGSFLQSKMQRRGVTCLNCHDAHTGDLRAEGNAVCAQCHSAAGNPKFPTLALKDYDGSTHSRHAEGTAGAACISCHMIERTYMGTDGRHDHSFRIPRPDLAAQSQSPDACTDCHTDQSPAWAAERISNWFPNSNHRGAHYGTVFATARQRPQAVPDDLMAIARDRDQSGIVRATALFLLQPVMTADLAAEMADLLGNSDPLVQSAAVSAQRAAPHADRITRLLPLLHNAPRMVRFAVARSLLDAPAELLSASQAALLRSAVQDWQRSLATKLDFPETHMVLGGMAMTLRNLPAAQAAFGTTVALDPQRAEAWSALVRLTAAAEGNAEAMRVVKRALKKIPDDPVLLQLQQDLTP